MWYNNRSWSIFVEKCLYSEVEKIESRVKDTSETLTIIDNLNKSNTLTSDCRLVSFDIINIFPSLDNASGLKAVKSILDPSKKIQFTMEVATDTLEFLDLKLKFDENLNKFLQMCLLNIPIVLYMFCLERVFLKITLKTSLKVLHYVLEGFVILMRNLKRTVQNIKTI